MRCHCCGSKARCIKKGPNYSGTAVVGIQRKYKCEECGSVFYTTELRDGIDNGNWGDSVRFNGER